MRFLLLAFVMMTTIAGIPDYVKLQLKPGPVQVENDRPATFEVRLLPNKGIHVNAEPAVNIKSLTEGVRFTIKQLPRKGEYVDPSKPIQVDCSVSGFTPGLHRIEFVLHYTYCSENEGWCRMNRDSAFVEINVKK